MIKNIRLGALASIAGMALLGFTTVAVAQKAPAAAPAATPAKPAAAKKAVAPSPCKGLAEDACGKMGETCSWIAATTRKDGKAVKAYCRKKAGFAAKKTKPAAPAAAATAPKETVKKAAAPKKAAAKKAAPPAAAAGAAPAKAN